MNVKHERANRKLNSTRRKDNNDNLIIFGYLIMIDKHPKDNYAR